MYLLFNNNGELIGCHEDLKVIEEYQSDMYSQHNIISSIKHIKDKKARMKFGDAIDDMYLTIYDQTYIPEKYVEYAEYTDYNIRDLRICRDTLMSLYRCENLSKREEKTLEKAIYLISDIMLDQMNYTPKLDELKVLKNHYDEMINGYNYNIYSQEQ